jgi:UDP-N-acetylmuramyl pentapeptide phosphotransferase/UDP-N-acetylglucosamine-1-phosphate transferase
MTAYLPALAAAPIAWIAIALLRRSRLAHRLQDRPNERSLHVDPTPRVGGIGLLIGALPVAALQASQPILVVLGCALALALVSALDDVRSLPIEVRLPAHVGAALLALLAIASPPAGDATGSWLVLATGLLAIAWMTNLFNFMDGADGLAAGMAIIGFGTLSIAAAHANAIALAWACAALAFASAGFLVHNFPPARVFLGDAGSIPLGFLAGALGIEGTIEGAWPWWFPVLVFLPFIADATVTVSRRLLRGETIWRAHREHFYQRVALAGMPRRRLALAAYALMLAVAVSALASLSQGALVRCAIIFGWLGVHALMFALLPRPLPVPGSAAARGAPGGGFERQEKKETSP